MTHLRIELNAITENVTSNVIHKLYETAKAIIDAEEANDVQESLVSLKGNLYTTACYRSEKLYLESKFPDLHITTGDYIVKFEDNVVENKLLSLYGVDGIITESRAASISLPTAADMFKNTSAVSFNELPLFTNWRTIKTGMFYLVSTLREIDLSNVTGVDTGAFYGCTSLTNLGDTGNITWVAQNGFRGCTALSSIDTSNITYIGPSAFLGCTGLTSVDLSAYTAGTALSCFEGCTSLTSVTLPSTSFTWGNNIENHKSMFRGCTSLASIDMSNATFIGKLYFQGCTALTTCIWPTSVTTIPQSCFYGCSKLVSIDLSNVTSIDSHAFNGCTSLTSVDLSNCTTLAGYPGATFRNCTNLATVTGLSSISDVGYGTFNGCTSLGTNLDLVLNITTNGLSGNTFRDTKFKTVTINGSNLTNIFDVTGSDVYPGICFMNSCIKMDFSNTKITSVGGLTGCSSIDTVIYPSTVTNINWNFTTGNSNATYIVLLATTPPVIQETTHFNFANNNCNIYVPDSSLSTYLTTDKWSGDKLLNRLKGISELPTSVTWVTKQSS